MLALTQGESVPSSRFRIKNIVERLKEGGIDIRIRDARVSAFPPASSLSRPAWLVRELLFRAPDLLSSYNYDVIVFQRELISTLPTLEALFKSPRVLDVDDAIWLHRGGLAANSLARNVDHIVCGNSYLADYFAKFGKPISIVPTGVDVSIFRPRHDRASNKIIGWSGTSGGFRFLYAIECALSEVLKRNPDWTLRIVSDQRPSFNFIPAERIEFLLWSKENEVESIASMDIGIMPLDDTAWSRGKCSYKMLLYMACGLPVVVSDFGMNREILNYDFVGYGASSVSDWVDSLSSLIADSELRDRLGKSGRGVVESFFSTEITAKMWVNILNSFVK